jgi:hypothetical protein
MLQGLTGAQDEASQQQESFLLQNTLALFASSKLNTCSILANDEDQANAENKLREIERPLKCDLRSGS